MFKQLIDLYGTPLVLVVLRVGGAAAAFALNLIFARTMTPDEMGAALTAMSLAMLLAIFVSLSTEAGAVRFITQYREKKALASARGFVRFNRRTVQFMGPMLCLFGLAVLALWTHFKSAPFPATFAIAFLVAILMGWLRIGAAHALAFGKVIRSIAPNSLFRQIFLLIGVVIWALTIGPPNAVHVMWLLLAGVAVALVIQHLWIRGLYVELESGTADMNERPLWMKVGLQLGLTLLFIEYSRDLTLIFAAMALAPSDIALLGVATALVGFTKFALVAINQSFTPKFAQSIARDDTQSLRQLIFTSNHMKFWPMIVALLGVTFLGEWILGMFGDEFRAAAPILVILMIDPLACAFFGPAPNYLSLSGKQFILLPLAVASLLLLALSINIGARIAGLEGAAWGVALTWIFWTGSMAFFVRLRAQIDTTMVSSVLGLMKGRG